MSEPGTISAATIGNAADDGSAGHCNIRAVQFGLAGQRNSAAMRAFFFRNDLGAEMHEHQFGVDPAGLGLNHCCHAGRGQAGQQDGRLNLRRGDRRFVGHWNRIARALHRHRQTAAVAIRGDTQRPSIPMDREVRRIGRLRNEASPSKGRCNRAARHRAHRKTAAGTAIAEIERLFGRCKSADANAPHRPGRFCGPLDPSAKGRHGPGGIENVFPLKKARNAGLADRQRAQNQGTMRDRLVAGNADTA